LSVRIYGFILSELLTQALKIRHRKCLIVIKKVAIAGLGKAGNLIYADSKSQTNDVNR
jgi:hypothetical protein